MIVLMTVGNNIIEARDIPDKNLQVEGYLEGLKKDMIEKNEDIIDLTTERPEFKFQVIIPPKSYIN